MSLREARKGSVTIRAMRHLVMNFDLSHVNLQVDESTKHFSILALYLLLHSLQLSLGLSWLWAPEMLTRHNLVVRPCPGGGRFLSVAVKSLKQSTGRTWQPPVQTVFFYNRLWLSLLNVRHNEILVTITGVRLTGTEFVSSASCIGLLLVQSWEHIHCHNYVRLIFAAWIILWLNGILKGI